MATLAFYEEPSEGIDVDKELEALEANRLADVRTILTKANAVIKTNSGDIYDSNTWGTLYRLESNRCFAFLRHAPLATNQWVLVMCGMWSDETSQLSEASRRFKESKNM